MAIPTAQSTARASRSSSTTPARGAHIILNVITLTPGRLNSDSNSNALASRTPAQPPHALELHIAGPDGSYFIINLPLTFTAARASGVRLHAFWDGFTSKSWAPYMTGPDASALITLIGIYFYFGQEEQDGLVGLWDEYEACVRMVVQVSTGQEPAVFVSMVDYVLNNWARRRLPGARRVPLIALYRNMSEDPHIDEELPSLVG
ncbi:hypothetical protein C8Q76DRAFT_804526 [Earliella scabrosa]|nr:hypothetical protein C8Q76DRAFT_804526 [Earliella scabrosa]